MTWLRKVAALLGFPPPKVAKPEPDLIAQSRVLRRDLRELRRLEVIVRRR